MALTAGQLGTIGHWQLVRLAGSGAWTNVYRARPCDCAASAPADYAVKLLQAEFQSDRQAIGMLQREAYVARQVSHPHLGAVLLAHVEAPPYYLVTPYLAGATLKQTTQLRERLPVPHALWIVRQAAEALATLHDAGWLHLDINPANLMIAPSGHTTVIDFGLARKLGDETAAKQTIAGTPAYMAPEAFQNTQPLTPAADLYSLGVVLYELLVGHVPFEDDDPLDLVNAHLETPPPALRHKLPHVPSRVARLVRRMLAKDPLRRPGVEELIATLATLEIDTFSERMVG
ncbi:MAG TPA: serine/threonine-protein kinase [Pirellulaceae bacterium]|nr:serine/threonine-protein kinase [Pirellulaceae bacterium]